MLWKKINTQEGFKNKNKQNHHHQKKKIKF